MRVMCCSTSSTSLQRAFKCPFHFYFNGRRFTYRRQINLRNLITAHQKSLKWMQKGESSALEFGTSQNDCILIVKCEIYWMFWALLLQSKLRSIYGSQHVVSRELRPMLADEDRASGSANSVHAADVGTSGRQKWEKEALRGVGERFKAWSWARWFLACRCVRDSATRLVTAADGVWPLGFTFRSAGQADSAAMQKMRGRRLGRAP